MEETTLQGKRNTRLTLEGTFRVGKLVPTSFHLWLTLSDWLDVEILKNPTKKMNLDYR